MISYREAHNELEKLNWQGIKWLLTKDMNYLILSKANVTQVTKGEHIKLIALSDVVSQAMKYLSAVNPAIVLKVID